MCNEHDPNHQEQSQSLEDSALRMIEGVDEAESSAPLVEEVTPQGEAVISGCQSTIAPTACLHGATIVTLPPSRLQQVRDTFLVITASEVGSDHLDGQRRGYGNQDCRGAIAVEGGIAIVVTDGCSASPHSKTGASLGVQLVLKAAEKLLEHGKQLPTAQEFATRMQADILEGIMTIARVLTTSDIDTVLHDSFLFTVLLDVVTPVWTAKFACGDGYGALNGDVQELSCDDGYPDYLAYLEYSQVPPSKAGISVRVVMEVDTRDLVYTLVATDGIRPIVGKTVNGFEIGEVVTNVQYRNGDHVRGVFRDVVQKNPRLFYDDATFGVILRIGPGLPSHWEEHRQQVLSSPVSQTTSSVVLPESSEQSDEEKPAGDGTEVDATPHE